MDVKESLINIGTAFPEDSKAEYNAIKEILTVVNREDNMRIVDNAVKLFLSQNDGKGGQIWTCCRKGERPGVSSQEKMQTSGCDVENAHQIGDRVSFSGSLPAV